MSDPRHSPIAQSMVLCSQHSTYWGLSVLSKKLTAYLTLAVVLMFGLIAVVPVQAIDVEPDDEPGSDTDNDEPGNDELELGADKTAFFERLMAAFPDSTVTVEQLQACFDEGWGLGDLVICAVISVDSGRSFEDVLALASSGMGWGEVAEESGIEARNLGQAISAKMGKKGLLWKGHEQDIEGSMQKNRGRGNAYGHDPQHRGGQPNDESDAEKSQGKGQGKGQSNNNGNGKGKGKGGSKDKQ